MQNTKKKRLIRIVIVILILLILGFLVWLFLPPFYPSGLGLASEYEIRDARMTICQPTSSCDAPEITTFSSGDDICIAWTDYRRTLRDHLVIIVSDSDSDERVFDDGDRSRYGTKCRQIRIPSARIATFSQGNYQTEFYRPVIWDIDKMSIVYWSFEP